MFKDLDYQFELNHSKYGYKNKEASKVALSSKAIKAYNSIVTKPEDQLVKMAFVREKVTVSKFVELATSGYTFCNLFKYDSSKTYTSVYRGHRNEFYPEYRRGVNKGAMKIQMKADDYFEGSQCIFVDIDYTRYDNVKDFLGLLPIKPTVVYMSYSDSTYKKDKCQQNNLKYDNSKGIWSRRFRLCYVFDEIIYGKAKFVMVSTAIHKMIEESTNEKIQDGCGERASQYFNGSVSKETYVPGCIYNVEDFSDYYDDITMPETISNGTDSQLLEWIEKCGQSNNKTPTINPTLINDMDRLEYEEFMKHYRHRFNYKYRKDDGVWKDCYQVVDDDYFALYFNTSKLKDGGKRRKKLYERMCLRRVMFPDINADQLLFCAYEDLHRFIDNSEDEISIDCLVDNVYSAFQLSIDEIEERYAKSIAYLKSRSPKRKLIFDLRGVESVSERNTMMKEIRYKYYDSNYNHELSVEANAKAFGITKVTMEKYCKDRNISTNHKVTDEELLQVVDTSLSIRGNITFLRDAYGMHVSKDRVSRIKNMKIELQKPNRVGKDSKGWFITFLDENNAIQKEYYPLHLSNSSYMMAAGSIPEFCRAIVVA